MHSYFLLHRISRVVQGCSGTAAWKHLKYSSFLQSHSYRFKKDVLVLTEPDHLHLWSTSYVNVQTIKIQFGWSGRYRTNGQFKTECQKKKHVHLFLLLQILGLTFMGCSGGTVRNCLLSLLLKSILVAISHGTLVVLANYLSPSIVHDYCSLYRRICSG